MGNSLSNTSFHNLDINNTTNNNNNTSNNENSTRNSELLSSLTDSGISMMDQNEQSNQSSSTSDQNEQDQEQPRYNLRRRRPRSNSSSSDSNTRPSQRRRIGWNHQESDLQYDQRRLPVLVSTPPNFQTPDLQQQQPPNATLHDILQARFRTFAESVLQRVQNRSQPGTAAQNTTTNNANRRAQHVLCIRAELLVSPHTSSDANASAAGTSSSSSTPRSGPTTRSTRSSTRTTSPIVPPAAEPETVQDRARRFLAELAQQNPEGNNEDYENLTRYEFTIYLVVPESIFEDPSSPFSTSNTDPNGDIVDRMSRMLANSVYSILMGLVGRSAGGQPLEQQTQQVVASQQGAVPVATSSSFPTTATPRVASAQPTSTTTSTSSSTTPSPLPTLPASITNPTNNPIAGNLNLLAQNRILAIIEGLPVNRPSGAPTTGQTQPQQPTTTTPGNPFPALFPGLLNVLGSADAYETLTALADILGPARPRHVEKDLVEQQSSTHPVEEDTCIVINHDDTSNENTSIWSRVSNFFTSPSDPSPTANTPRIETRCAICLQQYQRGETVRVLKCQHRFHQQCIDTWLTGYVNSCPMCRNEAVAVKTSDEA